MFKSAVRCSALRNAKPIQSGRRLLASASPSARAAVDTTQSTTSRVTPPSYQVEVPQVYTQIPGPRTKAAAAELNEVFDTRSVSLVVDYEKSHGNFMADADGNILLDCFAQIASIPLGYNNPALIEAMQKPDTIRALVNRPAIGNFPSTEWLSQLQSGLLRAAPPGMNQIFTSLSGSDANETAYKAAFMWRAQRDRNNGDFTPDDISSSMLNQQPGSPNYSVLSFKGGFHGRTFGSLSTTRSKPIHKLDIPAFDWPCAPFPSLKYPLEAHEAENAAEEARCLAATEEIFTTFHNPVAAVVVEPVQSEGGDNHATPSFYRGLRELTLKHNILLIVDEVQTGVGATGKFWAHEHWNLTTPPDMVTFSKKAQAAGYYFHDRALRPNLPYRQFNTWMGDPARAILFGAILEQIEQKNLVQRTSEVGRYLFSALERLSERFPNDVMNLRGKDRGTFIAFDCVRRDEVVTKVKNRGVNIGACGESAIRLRPMLIFEEKHADILLSTLEAVFES